MILLFAGAFMFIAIEGEADKERESEMVKRRDSITLKLWNMMCCEVNDKTEFTEK